MGGTVLLTGASGFLGMELLTRLLEQTDSEVIVLLRTSAAATAQERLAGVVAQLYDEVPAGFADRVTPVAGDISLDGLGLSDADRREILARATSIVHCAAAVAFDQPADVALNVNAIGTSRMLTLGLELAERGRLRRIVHVSTAYVSGRHVGVFGEDDLDLEQSYRNSYEVSKAHAERIVRAARELPIVVARPSIVVGDSSCGWTPVFNVVYWPLQAFSRGLIDKVPAREDGILDIVPIDFVAEGILALHELGELDVDTVHLVAGEHAVSNRELAALACRHFDLPPLSFAQDGELPRTPEAGGYVPYFDVRASFDDRNARRILAPRGVRAPRLESYFATIADYAQRAKWGKRALTRESAHREARGLPTASPPPAGSGDHKLPALAVSSAASPPSPSGGYRADRPAPSATE
jgi:thioester reductase-like protein